MTAMTRHSNRFLAATPRKKMKWRILSRICLFVFLSKRQMQTRNFPLQVHSILPLLAELNCPKVFQLAICVPALHYLHCIIIVLIVLVALHCIVICINCIAYILRCFVCFSSLQWGSRELVGGNELLCCQGKLCPAACAIWLYSTPPNASGEAEAAHTLHLLCATHGRPDKGGGKGPFWCCCLFKKKYNSVWWTIYAEGSDSQSESQKNPVCPFSTFSSFRKFTQ